MTDARHSVEKKCSLLNSDMNGVNRKAGITILNKVCSGAAFWGGTMRLDGRTAGKGQGWRTEIK